MAEKKPVDPTEYLHIFVNMNVPEVHVSIRGTTANAKGYLESVKGRDMQLRHIRVTKTDIIVNKENGVIIE